MLAPLLFLLRVQSIVWMGHSLLQHKVARAAYTESQKCLPQRTMECGGWRRFFFLQAEIQYGMCDIQHKTTEKIRGNVKSPLFSLKVAINTRGFCSSCLCSTYKIQKITEEFMRRSGFRAKT